MIAIGVIDTLGLVSTVEALDTCLKTAQVRLAHCERVSGGIVSFTVTGDVAAVKSAVDAGVAAAERLGGYLHHTVIARIDAQTGGLFDEAAEASEPTPTPELAVAASQPIALAKAAPKTLVKTDSAPEPAAAPESESVAALEPESKDDAASQAEPVCGIDANLDVIPEPEPEAQAQVTAKPKKETKKTDKKTAQKASAKKAPAKKPPKKPKK